MSSCWRTLYQLYSPCLTWASCCCPFLYNFLQLAVMAATGDLKVQTICLWVSMTDLALCSMCNMYRNTMHLCIYCQKNVQHVAHKTGTIWVFFFTILQYFYRNCCVGPGLNTFDQKQQISISRNCFQVQCEKFMPVNISYAHITLTETTQLARHVIFHLKKS